MGCLRAPDLNFGARCRTPTTLWDGFEGESRNKKAPAGQTAGAKGQVRAVTIFNSASHESKSQPASALAAPRSTDIANLLLLGRSDRYRVRVVARQRGNSLYVALVGEMLAKQGTWIQARTFNIRTEEIDDLVTALGRAKERLS